MTSISSFSGSSVWAQYANAKNTQKAQTSSVVDKLFEKLDTKQQGFLDKSELQATLSANASGNSTSSASADEMFSAMDADGDGKITEQELSTTLESLADKMDNLAASMRVHGGRGKHGADEGFTKDQLTQMAQDTNGTDSKRSAFMGQIAANFEQADINGDGKVNREEAKAYAKANGLEMGGAHGAGEPHGAKAAQEAGGAPSDGAVPADSASDSSSTATASTDPADTNGDGKVSAKEAVDYLLAQLAKTDNTPESSDTSSSSSSAKEKLDAQVSRQISHLVKAYGLGSSAANDASSAAQTLSASA